MARLIAVAVAGVGGVALGGCSDLYYARRDTIALGAGDAIAANKVGEMYDPWPAHSGNTNIAANGQRMQSAVERYRFDRVIPPRDPNHSMAEDLQRAQAAQSNPQSASSGSTIASPSVTAAAVSSSAQ
jgi:hypothetical protein